jgi:hypothetical protein
MVKKEMQKEGNGRRRRKMANHSSVLKVEVAGASEMTIFYWITQHRILKDNNLHIHSHENPKSHY